MTDQPPGFTPQPGAGPSGSPPSHSAPPPRKRGKPVFLIATIVAFGFSVVCSLGVAAMYVVQPIEADDIEVSEAVETTDAGALDPPPPPPPPPLEPPEPEPEPVPVPEPEPEVVPEPEPEPEPEVEPEPDPPPRRRGGAWWQQQGRRR